MGLFSDRSGGTHSFSFIWTKSCDLGPENVCMCRGQRRQTEKSKKKADLKRGEFERMILAIMLLIRAVSFVELSKEM